MKGNAWNLASVSCNLASIMVITLYLLPFKAILGKSEVTQRKLWWGERCVMTDILCSARNSYTDTTEGAGVGRNYVAIRREFRPSFRMLWTDPIDIPNTSATSQSVVLLTLGQVSWLTPHFPRSLLADCCPEHSVPLREVTQLQVAKSLKKLPFLPTSALQNLPTICNSTKHSTLPIEAKYDAHTPFCQTCYQAGKTW